MITKEIACPYSPLEQKYKEWLADFEKRRAEILAAAQTSKPKTRWPKVFGGKNIPNHPSPEDQLAAIEGEFFSWLYSDRQMLVCHLKANPEKQEGIITGYLNSTELLKDIQTLGEFFSFWLEEFFQKTDTGPLENLPRFIKNSALRSLPIELHQARRNIFEPLFTSLNGKEKEIFKNVSEIGLFGVGKEFAKALLETSQSLPNSLKIEYQKFVNQLVRIESGMIPIAPTEPEPKKSKPAKNRKPILKPAPQEPTPPPEFPPPQKVEYSFLIVLGPNTEPQSISTLEELEQAMKKIKGLGPVKPQDVWKCLQEIAATEPTIRAGRYKERVADGPFRGWFKTGLGRKYRLLFTINKSQVTFRVGPHEGVYATGRRKPHDRTRSL